jgi:hypothetical protein
VGIGKRPSRAGRHRINYTRKAEIVMKKVKLIAVATASALAVAGVAGTAAAHIGYIPPVYYEPGTVLTDSTAPVDPSSS